MKLQKQNLEKYNKCIELYSIGIEQKEISKKLDISVQTISKWLKPVKADIKNLAQTKANIIERINLALKNNEPASVIKDLSYSLMVLKSM